MGTRDRQTGPQKIVADGYAAILSQAVDLLEQARHGAARVVNAVMTATYWQIGRLIVEAEQHGARRAGYGERLIERLSRDLTQRFGRGFGYVNLTQMRRFHLTWAAASILQTASEEFRGRLKLQTKSEDSRAIERGKVTAIFPLPWSHYVRLLSVENPHARIFYETEALRGGWTVKQLDRQIDSHLVLESAV